MELKLVWFSNVYLQPLLYDLFLISYYPTISTHGKHAIQLWIITGNIIYTYSTLKKKVYIVRGKKGAYLHSTSFEFLYKWQHWDLTIKMWTWIRSKQHKWVLTDLRPESRNIQDVSPELQLVSKIILLPRIITHPNKNTQTYYVIWIYGILCSFLINIKISPKK